MQPLMRFVTRPIYDSAAASASRGAAALPPPSIRASIRALSPCPACQCQPLLHRRLFVDSHKPTSFDRARPNAEPAPSSQPSSLSAQDDISPRQAHELPSAEEQRRSSISKRFSTFMDALQGNVFIASQRLNDLTGYSGIEALKESIVKLEAQLSQAQNDVRAARTVYKTTIADRAASQREVTGLLARKDTWTPGDLERFTSLYRSDHGNEQAVQEAATRLAEAERTAEKLASKLNTSILTRYHEEQVWSDKIRRASTWGTWGLMGVNVLLFFVFQFGFEPWRRARLVNGFEDKVREALEREKALVAQSGGITGPVPALQTSTAEGTQDLKGNGGVPVAAASPEDSTDRSAYSTQTISVSPEAVSSDTTGPTEALKSLLGAPTSGYSFPFDWRSLEAWQAAAQDLFSERIVPMKKQDITFIALEGVASGAAIVGLIAILIFRPS